MMILHFYSLFIAALVKKHVNVPISIIRKNNETININLEFVDLLDFVFVTSNLYTILLEEAIGKMLSLLSGEKEQNRSMTSKF